MKLPRVLLVCLLIVGPAVLRAAHFQRSLAPLGALALFCGARFRNRWLALSIPIASTALGDVLLGMTHHDSSYTFHRLVPVIYGCYALSVAMGIGLNRYWRRLESECQKRNELGAAANGLRDSARTVLATRVVPIAAATLAGSVVFFLVTNFGVWYGSDLYPQSWSGLLDCYAAAIPFFRRGTLLADVVGSILLFGGDYLLRLNAAPQPQSELRA